MSSEVTKRFIGYKDNSKQAFTVETEMPEHAKY